MASLTRSPIDSKPISSPFSTTGRCRKWLSVMTAMQCSMLCWLSAVITGELMMALTGVPTDERPSRTTLRA
ncbi:hypothetical protein D3C85_1937330 [compost metagenome]